jgi:Predicted nucleotide-binding protein containing TIR-like domain
MISRTSKKGRRSFRDQEIGWRRRLGQRRALALQSTGATVLEWQTDFIAGRSILAQIEEAASRCNAGIFLFTKDDDLVDNGQPDTSAPRDNVVFEAGYFIGLRGKRNVLIVREQGSKMPADLGGDIYALLPDKVDIGPIERVVSGFMAALWLHHGSSRLFFLPPYSPDRNPDELVWKHLKADTVGRMAVTGKTGFKRKVRSSMRRLQNDPGKIRSFYAPAKPTAQPAKK